MTRRRRIWARILVWGAVSLLLLGCGTIMGLKAAFNAGKFDAPIAKEVREALGLDLSFDQATYSFPGTVTVVRPKLKAVDAGPAVRPLSCESITVEIALNSLTEPQLEEVRIGRLDARLRLDEGFELAELPGGLERLLASTGPGPGAADPPEAPSPAPRLPMETLPFPVALDRAHLQVELPDGEVAQFRGDVQFGSARVQGAPALTFGLEGAAEAYGTKRDLDLSLLIRSTQIRLSALVAKLGRLEGNITLAHAGDAETIAMPIEGAEAELSVQCAPFELDVACQFARRFGLDLPSLGGLASGQAEVSLELSGEETGSHRVEVRPDFSVKRVSLPVEMGTVGAEQVTLKGRLSATLKGSDVSFGWSDAKVTVEKPTYVQAPEQGFQFDRLIVQTDGKGTSASQSTSGTFTVSREGEDLTGEFALSLGPTGLAVSRFMLAWPSLGQVAGALEMDPDFTRIQSASVELKGIGLKNAMERLGPAIPRDLARWAPVEKLAGTIRCEGLPVVSDSWLTSLRESSASVGATFSLGDGEGRISSELAAHVDKKALAIERLSVETPWGTGLLKARLDKAWTQAETASLEVKEVRVGAVLAQVREYLPADLRSLALSGSLSAEAQAAGLPLPLLSPMSASPPTTSAVKMEVRTKKLEMRGALGQSEGASVPRFAATISGDIQGNAQLEGLSYSLAHHSWRSSLTFSELEVDLPGTATLKAASGKLKTSVSGKAAALSGTGEFSILVGEDEVTGTLGASVSRETWRLTTSKIDWPKLGVLELTGATDPQFRTLSEASFRLVDLDVGLFTERFKSHLPPEVLAWSPSGKLSVAGQLEGLSLELDPQTPATSVPAPFRLRLDAQDFRVRKAFSVLKPFADTPELSGALSGSAEIEGRLDLPGQRVRSPWLDSLSLEAQASLPVAQTSLVAQLKAKVTPEFVELTSLQLRGEGPIGISTTAKGRRKPRPAGLPSLSFTGQLEGDPLALVGIDDLDISSFKITDIDLGLLHSTLAPLLPDALRAYTPSGTFSVDFRTRVLALSSQPSLDGCLATIQLRGASLLPVDEDLVEGIEELDVDFQGKLDRGGEAGLMACAFSVTLANALAYRDVFLADLTDREVELGGSAQFSLEPFKIRKGRGSLSLPGELKLEVEGVHFDHQPAIRARAKIHLEIPKNDQLLADLRESVGEVWHWLNLLELGGKTALEVSVDYGPEQIAAGGALSVGNASMAYGQTSVKGMNLRLPFSVGWPKAPKSEEPMGFGLFLAEALQPGFIVLEGLRLPLKIEGNRLVTQEVRDDLLGGKLRLSAIETTDLLSEGRSAEGKLEIKGVRLERLFQPLGLSGLKGGLDAQLDRMAFSQRSLDLSGQARLDLFGGTVEVKNLSAREMFSDLSRVGFDLVLRELSLEAATSLPGLGKMTGILEGDITGIEVDLSTGQPIRLDADVRTTKRKGVKQIISGEAIRALALAGAPKAGVSFYNLAGDYRYEVFGFTAKLRNDILSLRGVGRSKDKAVVLVPPLVARRKVVLSFQPEIHYPTLESRLRGAIKSVLEAGDTGDVKVEME